MEPKTNTRQFYTWHPIPSVLEAIKRIQSCRNGARVEDVWRKPSGKDGTREEYLEDCAFVAGYVADRSFWLPSDPQSARKT